MEPSACTRQVGAGLLAELNFATEADHIRRFARMYERQLKQLGVIVPEARPPRPRGAAGYCAA